VFQLKSGVNELEKDLQEAKGNGDDAYVTTMSPVLAVVQGKVSVASCRVL
jgi:hypothetical protein